MMLPLMLLLFQQPEPGPPPSYVPHRVYDSHAKRFTDLEAMASRLGQGGVALIGEEHDDPATHRIELAILESIARRRDTAVVLSLEMFERDVQPLVDHYLDGKIGEADLLATARPWPRYRSDYRGLVELAKSLRVPVVASNVPRPLATLVSRAGATALDTLADSVRRNFAAERSCPLDDDYAKSFRAVMKEMPNHGAPATPAEMAERVDRMYLAQCLKDETMGESVARAWSPGKVVVHYNGSFHTDFGRGTAERVRRRLPDAKVTVISVLPVASLDDLDPDKKERKRGDYLIFVLKPAPANPAPANP